MRTEIKYLNDTLPVPPLNLPASEIAYFDIETTGFAADVTALYLIGCISIENDRPRLIQWFADDNKSEKPVLEAFLEFIKTKKYLICYNGTGFDLPYIRKKCAKHGLDIDSLPFKVIDFYREFASFKNLLPLGGLKQKEVEKYLEISREDKFSGGELISYYGKFLKLNYGKSPEAEDIYKILTLHNGDDLTGLFKLTPLYNFLKSISQYIDCEENRVNFYADVKTNGKNEKILQIGLVFEFSPPKDLFLSKEGYTAYFYSQNESMAILELPVVETELKFFYKDYKNYYYLPKEDSIIHKSLAGSVDKENKEKAAANNCYTRHRGTFAVQPVPAVVPALKSDYSDKTLYFVVDDKFLSSGKDVNRLAKEILKFII